jgi:hypothetical protein
MIRKFLISIATIALCYSCKETPSKIEITNTEISIDSLKLATYADTIVCDMVVKNPDKEDVWTEECLKKLKRQSLIDTIFNEVYNGKLLAYDYETAKPLSIKEVKRIEETSGYSREIIGKFQFREAWFYDNKNHTLIKKVQSIIFGYETYDDKGFVKGYKPLFKVIL